MNNDQHDQEQLEEFDDFDDFDDFDSQDGFDEDLEKNLDDFRQPTAKPTAKPPVENLPPAATRKPNIRIVEAIRGQKFDTGKVQAPVAQQARAAAGAAVAARKAAENVPTAVYRESMEGDEFERRRAAMRYLLRLAKAIANQELDVSLCYLNNESKRRMITQITVLRSGKVLVCK